MKMDFNDSADVAQAEIHEAKTECREFDFDDDSRQKLWGVFRKWMDDPRCSDSFSGLSVIVLNELCFTLADEALWAEAWDLIRRTALQAKRRNQTVLMESLRIAIFELAAEPLAYPKMLELLFSLADEPDGRWAVFSAYRSCPWRLRPHARRYSNGLVTDSDCDGWLIENGYGGDEVLMKWE